jgi:D-alanyl-D-alanine endopeptidase (penicillin-binding protein 7)
MNKFVKENKEILKSIGIIVVPLAILFTIFGIVSTRNTGEAVTEQPVAEVETSNPFQNIDVIAKSAIVKDLNTGEILYSKEPEVPRPLASITKVMTAVVSEENDSREVITISMDDLKKDGDSQLWLGETFHRNDLINLTLVSSSNDGASALAAGAINFSTVGKENFIERMNSEASKIGMKNTHFYNETGLDSSEFIAGAHGSANDVAKLFEYVIENKPNLLESTRESNISIRSITGFIHSVSNTNEIVSELPNILASKTGYTDLAGGNLAVVIDPGLSRPISIVVLGSTEEGRFEDVSLLAEKTIEYFSFINN